MQVMVCDGSSPYSCYRPQLAGGPLGRCNDSLSEFEHKNISEIEIVPVSLSSTGRLLEWLEAASVSSAMLSFTATFAIGSSSKPSRIRAAAKRLVFLR
jgi:hypothetical protein